ncbi:hypothetical protein [Ramlibacter alkalitolerans]|uniref:NfeD family protein n=1 Tax=Ramlibacter alkalitolerans TaxID=2039631 RepID=A0ABS1JU69_9BURK|nr:hypothetical protein [Ramlibacter alkalitolerans]MBL0427716.1 hypothetical protein [Ramlibacter alkalitolerans]
MLTDPLWLAELCLTFLLLSILLRDGSWLAAAAAGTFVAGTLGFWRSSRAVEWLASLSYLVLAFVVF